MTTPSDIEVGGELVVVVVSYGPATLLDDALGTVGDRYPTIVVDNASSSHAKDVAERHGAHYLDPGANLGYARAVNMALEARRPPDADVLLLNPDARISPEAVDRLRQMMLSHNSVACVAPAQHVAGSNRASPVWWPWHTPGGAWVEALGLRRLRSTQGFLGGAILLVRGAALASVGSFDDRYFLYSEEEDWQRRARRLGWSVRLCSDVEAVHARGGTETDIDRQQLRVHVAIERYIRKWYGTLGWTCYRAGTLFGFGLRLVAYRGAPRQTIARLARVYVEGPDRAGQRRGAVPAPGADAYAP